LKKIEPRFIAGPPGTGKTHGFILDLYKELLLKYHPDKIIILSHTNVAADQIKDAILALPIMKERGFTKKSMKYKICTIHSYCFCREHSTLGLPICPRMSKLEIKGIM